MKAPEIIIIVILACNLLYSAYKHNEPKDGDHNLWISLAATAITFGLYWWAGLFH